MKRALAVLVVVALALAVAAFAVPQNAASVNGVTLSQSSLNSDLSAIAHSDDFQCYLDSRIVLQSQGQVNGLTVFGVSSSQSNPATFTSTFTGYWLSQRINGELLDQMAAARHLTLTPTDLAFGRLDLSNTITTTIKEVDSAANGEYARCEATGSQVLASLPTDFVNQLVRTQATGDALEAHAAGASLTAAALAAYFAAHRAKFDSICVSGIPASTEAQAAQYRAQVEAGTPFAQVAKAAGESNGGAFGCFSPSNASQFENIQSVTEGLKIGQLSQPLADGSTYVVLEVTQRKPSTYESASQVVRAALLAAGVTKVSLSLQHKVKTSTVSVNPRYGRYVPANTVEIAPPASPPRTSVLNPSANVAGSAGPSAPTATPVPGAAGGG